MIRRFELIIDPTQWTEIDEITNLMRSDIETNWHPTYFTVEDFIVSKSWSEVAYGGFDPNDLQGNKPCCGGGVGVASTYRAGKWHDQNCDSLKPPQLPTGATSPPSGSDYTWISTKQRKCTCGSSAVGSDRHSDYCDIK